MHSEEIYDEKHPFRPLSMFRFFPYKDEDLHTGEGKSFKRFIFEGDALQKMSQFQKQEESKFESYIEKKKEKIPAVLNNPFWTRAWRYRWLVSLHFDHKRAIKQMTRYNQYLKTNRFDVTKRSQFLLKSGVIYFSGRDSSYRPIIIFDIAKMLQLKVTGQELLEAEKFFLEFIVENVMLPGHAETLVAVVDCGYKNVFSMLGMVRDSINFLQSHFRCRMRSAYLIKIPPTASFLWGIIKNFIHEDTLKRMFIIDGDSVGPLFKTTHPSQIQKKFHGTQENITQYWPLKKVWELGDREYHCEDDDPKLISVHKYQQKYKQGKLKKYIVSEKLLSQEMLNPKFEQFVTDAPPVADNTHKQEIIDPNVVFPAEKYPTQPESPDVKSFDWFDFKELQKTEIN